MDREIELFGNSQSNGQLLSEPDGRRAAGGPPPGTGGPPLFEAVPAVVRRCPGSHPKGYPETGLINGIGGRRGSRC